MRDCGGAVALRLRPLAKWGDARPGGSGRMDPGRRLLVRAIALGEAAAGRKDTA
jgi:hypothetical protein